MELDRSVLNVRVNRFNSLTFEKILMRITSTTILRPFPLKTYGSTPTFYYKILAMCWIHFLQKIYRKKFLHDIFKPWRGPQSRLPRSLSRNPVARYRRVQSFFCCWKFQNLSYNPSKHNTTVSTTINQQWIVEVRRLLDYSQPILGKQSFWKPL